MKNTAYISYALSAVTLILTIWAYFEYQSNLGFPDGFISEYSRIANIIFKVSVLPLIAFGAYFFYLAWMSSKEGINKKLKIASSLLLLFIITMTVIDKVLYTYLNHGQGG